MSLYDELERGLLECKIDEEVPGPNFLPLSVLNDNITKDNIKAQLEDKLKAPSLLDKIFLHAKKVFAILVLIEESSAIQDLIEQDDLTDGDLPLCRKGPRGHSDYNILLSADRKKSFNSFASWTRRKSVQEFLKDQWVVQAPVLEYLGQHLTLDSQCPLPFTESVRRSAGSSGVVYQSKLHLAHQQVFKIGEAPYVALKQISPTDPRDSSRIFEKEKENLEKVQRLQNKHLIKLIAICTRGPQFYFIFPWADGGNLKDFWKRENSKSRNLEIILWSLQQMLGIIDGLKALHAKNGRHGDFKPQNILHFKKSDEETGGRGTLVIADVGVSRFHKEATRLRHVATAARESTVSYEAPEAEPDRLKGIPRSRKYDMWSIGCMYLEFTIWLVYGNNAVRRFRGRREAKDDPTTTGAWSFFTHNDKGATKIHAAVSEAISILLQDKRCNGTALEDLVILIRDQLLQIDVQQRAEASLLHERFEIIVRAAEEDPSYLWKTLAISPPTPRFFRSRKDFNPTPNTSASDSSTSQDTLSTRSDGSEPT